MRCQKMDMSAALESRDYDLATRVAREHLSGKERLAAIRTLCYCAIKRGDLKDLADAISQHTDLHESLRFERAYLQYRTGEDAGWYLDEPPNFPAVRALQVQIALSQGDSERAYALLADSPTSLINFYAAGRGVFDGPNDLLVTNLSLEVGTTFQTSYNRALASLTSMAFAEALEYVTSAIEHYERTQEDIANSLRASLHDEERVKPILLATTCTLNLLRQFARVYAHHPVNDTDLISISRRIRDLDGFIPTKEELEVAARELLPLPPNPFFALRMCYKTIIVCRALVFAPGQFDLQKSADFLHNTYVDEEHNSPEFNQYFYSLLRLDRRFTDIPLPPETDLSEEALLTRISTGDGKLGRCTWLLILLAQSEGVKENAHETIPWEKIDLVPFRAPDSATFIVTALLSLNLARIAFDFLQRLIPLGEDNDELDLLKQRVLVALHRQKLIRPEDFDLPPYTEMDDNAIRADPAIMKAYLVIPSKTRQPKPMPERWLKKPKKTTRKVRQGATADKGEVTKVMRTGRRKGR